MFRLWEAVLEEKAREGVRVRERNNMTERERCWKRKRGVIEGWARDSKLTEGLPEKMAPCPRTFARDEHGRRYLPLSCFDWAILALSPFV